MFQIMLVAKTKCRPLSSAPLPAYKQIVVRNEVFKVQTHLCLHNPTKKKKNYYNLGLAMHIYNQVTFIGCQHPIFVAKVEKSSFFL